MESRFAFVVRGDFGEPPEKVLKSKGRRRLEVEKRKRSSGRI